ncbi:MAG: glycosyl hydrolase family 8 [Roseococcus sp.]|nr:glycosyl hydrolase family 8 [Roseococcus sp.]
MLPRRLALLGLPALIASPARAESPRDGFRRRWAEFRDRFLAPEGRVVDTGNGGISHSEGQGWGMLCAARAEDRAAFERLYAWSMRVLKRPVDELFSWRFHPGSGVDDPNNATDGDIFIAWALLEAGDRWGRAEWQAQGAAMARDILHRLVRPVGAELLLLPGLRGFERPGQTVVNPSYYAFPALRALALAAPDPAWFQLVVDGLALLRRGRFGRWRLPPDWLAWSRGDGRLAPAPGWPARFSYDAVRVPLYLAWAGLVEEPGVTGPARFWHEHAPRMLPAWTDLSNNELSPYPASRGTAAVAQLARDAAGMAGLPRSARRASLDGENYYSAILVLLVDLAVQDRGLS